MRNTRLNEVKMKRFKEAISYCNQKSIIFMTSSILVSKCIPRYNRCSVLYNVFQKLRAT